MNIKVNVERTTHWKYNDGLYSKMKILERSSFADVVVVVSGMQLTIT